jgi:hypothetical protein
VSAQGWRWYITPTNQQQQLLYWGHIEIHEASTQRDYLVCVFLVNSGLLEGVNASLALRKTVKTLVPQSLGQPN